MGSTELEDLVEFVKKNGIVNPIKIKEETGKYILLVGQRRLKAAIAAGLEEECEIINVEE